MQHYVYTIGITKLSKNNMDDLHIEAYQSYSNDAYQGDREREQVREEEQYDKELWDEKHSV